MLDVVLAAARLVRVGLHGDDGAAPVLPVRGHQHLGAGVLHAELEGLGGEASEHEGVDRADARARERDDDGFGDHREVDDHAVALHHPEFQQCVGGLGNLALQVRIGVDQAIPGFTLEVEGHVIAAAGLHVTIHAVVGDVELAALEPCDLRDGEDVVAGLVRADFLRLVEAVGRVPRLRPVQTGRLLGPELLARLIRDQRGIGRGRVRV